MIDDLRVKLTCDSDLTYVSVGRSQCMNVVWFNSTYLTCMAGAGTGQNLPVNVTVNSSTYSYNVFSYIPPKVITTTNQNTAGGWVTVRGSNFGNNAAVLTVRMNGAVCSNPFIVTAHAAINCTVGPGYGSDLYVIVTVDGQTSEPVNVYRYNPPFITQTSSASTDGGTITITGNNFGPAGTPAYVTLNSEECYNPVVLSHTTMTCTVGPGTGEGHLCYVHVGGQESRSYPYAYSPPTMTYVDVASPYGSMVALRGSNFGTDYRRVTIRMNGQDCTTGEGVKLYNSTFLQCMAPPGVGAGLSVTITVDGLTSTYPTSFRYIPPMVTSSTSVGTLGGTVSIHGNFFGLDISKLTVTIGPMLCTDPSLRSFNNILCSIGSNDGGFLPLVVTAGNQNSNSYNYTALAPIISAVATVPTSGGRLFITAAHMGTKTSLVSVLGCTDVVLSGTTVSCVIVAGIGANISSVLTVNRLSTSFMYSYTSPAVTSIESPPTSGGQITIYGSNFGPGTSTTVRIDGILCSNQTVSSNLSTIACTVGAGSGTKNVDITVGNQMVTSSMSYQLPFADYVQGLPTSAGNENIIICIMGLVVDG